MDFLFQKQPGVHNIASCWRYNYNILLIIRLMFFIILVLKCFSGSNFSFFLNCPFLTKKKSGLQKTTFFSNKEFFLPCTYWLVLHGYFLLWNGKSMFGTGQGQNKSDTVKLHLKINNQMLHLPNFRKVLMCSVCTCI